MANNQERVQQLPVRILQPNPLHPRDDINEESLQDLKKSIALQGVLEPILVAATPAGYQIIAGERRWRAAKLAGLKTIPAVVKEISPQQMLEMALIEDVQRKGLNPLDKTKAFKRLRDEFGLPIKEIAAKVGKSTSYVINSIRLLNLPDALKDGLLSGLISEGHARALMGLEETRLMIEAYKQVLRERASVRRTEELVRQMRSGQEDEIGSGASYSDLQELQEKLERLISIPAATIKVEQTKAMFKLEIRARGKVARRQLFFRLQDLFKKVASKKAP